MKSFGIMDVPASIRDPQLRRFLMDMRNAVVTMQASLTVPRDISNLRVTPVAGGNVIDFTRSDADQYLLYWSTTPKLGDAQTVDMGVSSSHHHNYARDGVKIYYWVRAVKKSGVASEFVGPKSGTTLALNVNTTLPTPPPGSDDPVVDETDGRVDYLGGTSGL